MKKSMLFFLFIAIIATSSFAQSIQIKNVAVVETQIDEASGVAAEISKAEVREITAEIRSMAVNILPGNRYNVMTSETVLAMGDAVLIDCAEENCVIALGTKIGADYIVRGTISKFGRNLTLLVETFDTDNGMLMASTTPVRTANLDELLEKGSAACAVMYKRFLERIDARTNRQTTSVAMSTSLPVVASPPKSSEPEPSRASTGSRGALSGVGSFTDPRDRKTYGTVTIGGKTWMAENLNYNMRKSWCYENDTANCNKYGRLYTLHTAMKACPVGWRLPTSADWDTLVRAVGGYSKAGVALKSRTGWQSSNTSVYVGTSADQYRFTALPGGVRWSGVFARVGNSSYWWSATKSGGGYVYIKDTDFDQEDVNVSWSIKDFGFSVRCLQN